MVIESFLIEVAIACGSMWVMWYVIWKEDGSERFPRKDR